MLESYYSRLTGLSTVGIGCFSSLFEQFFCLILCVCMFHWLRTAWECATNYFTYLLHSFTHLFLCAFHVWNYIFFAFSPQFIYVCFYLLFFNVEFNHSYSIIVYFLTIFIFSYVVHSKKLRVIPLCCLKGLSALQCAERGEHKDLVSLLSKCLNV